MYKFSYIKEELLYLENHLKKAKIYNDSRVFINEAAESKIISWHNYNSGILKTHYLSTFKYIVSSRQYSYQFKDGSLIQFYYDFLDENTLRKAKLAYYPLPHICSEINDEDLIEYIETYGYDNIDTIIENQKLTNTAYIRIDYDSNVTSHDKCEIQIDSIKEIRIPCEVLINPIYFLEFILKCKSLTSNDFKSAFAILKNDEDFKTKLNISRKKQFRLDNFSNQNIFVTFLHEYI
jgi:hypothetical protein